jgi:uncharacterized protein YlxW (UPF0749 family)
MPERRCNRAPLARRLRWQGAPVLLGTALATSLLGFVIGGQVRQVPRRGQLAALSRDPAVQAIALLEQEQAVLRRSVDEARSRLTEGEWPGAEAQRTLAGIRAELERERLAAGLLPVTGQGVLVRLDDSTLRSLPPQEDPNNYLIHDYDLRDLVSALWAAGAEALAVNDQRVVATTTVTAVGPAILVNDTRLSPPFEVRVVATTTVTAVGLPFSSMTRASPRPSRCARSAIRCCSKRRWRTRRSLPSCTPACAATPCSFAWCTRASCSSLPTAGSSRYAISRSPTAAWCARRSPPSQPLRCRSPRSGHLRLARKRRR